MRLLSSNFFNFNYRSGDITTLQVDAIVNSTNESMNDSNPVSDRIFQKAGSALKEEINLDIRGLFLFLGDFITIFGYFRM